MSQVHGVCIDSGIIFTLSVDSFLCFVLFPAYLRNANIFTLDRTPLQNLLFFAFLEHDYSLHCSVSRSYKVVISEGLQFFYEVMSGVVEAENQL